MGKILTEEDLVLQSYFIRGYKTLGSKLSVNQELLKIYQIASKLENDIYYGDYCTKIEDVVSYTKIILDKYYSMHDVLHIPNERVKELSEESKELAKTKDVEKKFDFIDKVESEIKLVNPFDIPLKNGKYDSAFNACLSIDLTGIPDSDYINEMFITFPEIIIDENLCDLSVPVYAHELTHSQIESVKNSCYNYQNCEVISIFNEKLCALELDPSGRILKETEKRRTKTLIKYIEIIAQPKQYNPLEVFKASFYITSTLKATHLFDKYINGSKEVKEKIITNIQNIFDRKMSVEELLEENDITYKNSCNSELIKRHI